MLESTEQNKVSKFSGGLLGLIGIRICSFLICIFSLFIAYPWAVCMQERWYAKHTILDGKQVYFDGTGGQLFGNYIKWALLTVITIGIYSFWLPLKMKAWVVLHTHTKELCIIENDGAEQTTTSKKNNIALLGFVLSFIYVWVGLILSVIALANTKKYSPENSYKGFAIGGIIVSLTMLILGVIIAFVVLMAEGINPFIEIPALFCS